MLPVQSIEETGKKTVTPQNDAEYFARLTEAVNIYKIKSPKLIVNLEKSSVSF